MSEEEEAKRLALAASHKAHVRAFTFTDRLRGVPNPSQKRKAARRALPPIKPARVPGINDQAM